MTQRITRFPDNRFIGTRDDMRWYDCDDPEDFAALATRVELEELIGRGLVSTFAPDSEAEAANRGFSPR